MVKQWKLITQQPKATEKTNIPDQKLVIIEHLKTLHKLLKGTRQAEKVSQIGDAIKSSDSLLFSETKKSENVLNEKNTNITKRSHAFKGYIDSYNVEILNSFNPDLQLNYTESAVGNKPIELR